MLEDVHTEILKSGILLIYGRDIYHRPIFILRPSVAIRNAYLTKVDEILRVICFAVFYMITHMFIEGKIENNLNIIDLEKALPWQLPIKFL